MAVDMVVAQTNSAAVGPTRTRMHDSIACYARLQQDMLTALLHICDRRPSGEGPAGTARQRLNSPKRLTASSQAHHLGPHRQLHPHSNLHARRYALAVPPLVYIPILVHGAASDICSSANARLVGCNDTRRQHACNEYTKQPNCPTSVFSSGTCR